MPTTVVVVSDTHVPTRARALPAEVWDAVTRADVVIHAGDWTTVALLDKFETRSKRLLAVRGNNDGPEFDERLPLIARDTIDGVRVAVVHETGAKAGREARADVDFPDADLVVFGHSHIPWDTVTPAGHRLLNPGSPTDRRRQPDLTYVTLVLDAGAVREVALHRMPPTAPARRPSAASRAPEPRRDTEPRREHG